MRTVGPISVRRVTVDDWEAMRSLRLASLLDAPEAFCATHGEEKALPEAKWRARAASNAAGIDTLGLVACGVDGEPVGMAVCVRQRDEVELNAVWVRPDARRTGAGRALVDAARGWAAECGVARMTLAVNADNAGAIRLYEHSGFVEVGRRPMPGRPGITLVTMRRG